LKLKKTLYIRLFFKILIMSVMFRISLRKGGCGFPDQSGSSHCREPCRET
jgi:hypothetical protein